MTAASPSPTGEYVAVWSEGQWQVVFKPDAAPEWWRVVASFSSRERAEDYVGLYQQILEDSNSDWPPGEWEEGEMPPLVETPPQDRPAAPAPPPEKSDKPKPSGESISGRTKQFYDWLCDLAEGDAVLPTTYSQAMSDANIPKGSHGYVRDTLEMRGFATFLSPDDGRWGVRLKDRRELYSELTGRDSSDAESDPAPSIPAPALPRATLVPYSQHVSGESKPSIASDILKEIEAAENAKPFAEPVKRRCERCQQIFDSERVGDVRCGACR